MKRILTVLALLTVCGAAFSVTGALYVRYNANNTITATEWGTSLEDLRVGRRGSGFDINTDTFGVSYKIRSAIGLSASAKNGNIVTNVGNGVADVAGAISATSPGYIQITGIKLGGASADIGGAWWTAGLSSSALNTNPAPVGTTNTQYVQNYGYNYFALNLDFNIPVTEKISFQAYPWDKIQFDFGTGSATRNGVSAGVPTTNDGASTHMGLILPLHLDIGGMDPISIGLFPKLAYTSDVNTFNAIGATNNVTSSGMQVGAMVRLGYKIDNVWGLYAHVGIDNNSTSTVYLYSGATGGTTNSVVANQLQAPLFVGVAFQPAGWVNLNVGLGYQAVLGSSSTAVSQTVPGGAPTTNITTTGGGLVETYGFFDEHGYALPFFKFAGSTKFATDWEVGMSTIVSMNGGAMGSTPTVSSTSTSGYLNQTAMLTFANNWNWDNQQCYIKYTKDAFSFQGMLGGNAGLGALFAFVDMSINF